jgi:C-terminal processing protease CtpA/Prc
MGVKIERVIKGSPAKKYDVRAGDIIISANETQLEDLDIYDAVDVIK